MAYYSGNLSFLVFFIFIYSHYCRIYFLLPFMLLLLSFNLATQLAHILNERLKEFSEKVVRENVGRDVATKTAKDKIKVADAAEKRTATTEKARVLIEKRLVELTTKQN